MAEELWCELSIRVECDTRAGAEHLYNWIVAGRTSPMEISLGWSDVLLNGRVERGVNVLYISGISVATPSFKDIEDMLNYLKKDVKLYWFHVTAYSPQGRQACEYDVNVTETRCRYLPIAYWPGPVPEPYPEMWTDEGIPYTPEAAEWALFDKSVWDAYEYHAVDTAFVSELNKEFTEETHIE